MTATDTSIEHHVKRNPSAHRACPSFEHHAQCSCCGDSQTAVRFGAFFLRTAPELVLKSRKVVSRVLADGGYAFQYPTIEEAIEDLSVT